MKYIPITQVKFFILAGLCIIDAVLIFLFFVPSSIASTPTESAKYVFEVCRGKQRYMECVGEEFAKVMKARGFAFVSQSLLQYQTLDPETQNCHVVSHEIMQSLTRKSPNLWKDILKEIDPSACGGGFMHGVLEVRVGEDPDFNVDKNLFDSICRNIYQGNFSIGCAHILGHIIFVEKEGDLELSLAVCEGLEETFLFECYGGVFMEDSFRTNFYDHGFGEEPVRNKEWFINQFARCRAHGDREPMEAGCFYDLAEVAAQTNDYDIAKTYDICMNARSKTAKDRCLIRASYIIATAPIPKIDAMDFSGLCQRNMPDGAIKSRCMHETISALMTYSILFVPRAKKFCQSLVELYRAACFEDLGRQIRNRVQVVDERTPFCTALSEPYRSKCMR